MGEKAYTQGKLFKFEINAHDFDCFILTAHHCGHDDKGPGVIISKLACYGSACHNRQPILGKGT